MTSDKIIYDCPNASCSEPLYTGRCKQECWDRYCGKASFARWKHRGMHNDFIWAECSNCGFRVENYKAVRVGKSSTDYVEVIYKFCPMCGKPMEV
jgi:ribosomal protein L33